MPHPLLFRKAERADAPIMAAHILLAMEDILSAFIGERSPEEAYHFMLGLVEAEGNQYSYENGWVAVAGHEVVASAIVYDGARLHELRAPVKARVRSLFNRAFEPEEETRAGEHYIDCAGVSPGHQGQGIGSLLFRFLIGEYAIQGNCTLGLLVDRENPRAKRLYLDLGFVPVGEQVLAGKHMEHLQYRK